MTGSMNFSLVYHLEPAFLSFHLEPDQMGWNKGPHLLLPGVAQSAAGSMVELNSAGPYVAFVYTHSPQYPY